MKKKAQAETALIYIIGILIVSGIIYIGYKQITAVTKTEKELSTEELKARIMADVEKTSAQLGAKRNFSYIIPADFNQLCFVDLSKKEKIEEEIKGINQIIMDSIKENATNNAFFLGNLFDAFNSGNLMVCDPFFICYNATQQRVNVEMHGTGTKTVIGPLCPEAINLPPNITYANPDPKDKIIQKANEYEINLNIVAEDPENSDLKIKWIVNNEEEKSETITSNSQSSFTTTLSPSKYKIIAVATDDFNLSDYKQWNVSIYPLTGAPFFVSFTTLEYPSGKKGDTQEDLPATYSIRINNPLFIEILAEDPENDKITYSAENLPFGALFEPTTRRFLWIPQKTDAPTGEGIRTYVVKFKATARDGFGETTATIEVNPNKGPVADFTMIPSPGFINIPVSFDASASSDEDGQIVSYEWNFGDGGTNITDEKQIEHIYTAPGTYTVTLKVKDNDDDYGEAKKEITVGIPQLDCKISPTCPFDDYEFGAWVIALSSPSNAHGSVISDTLVPPYSTNKICCSSNIELGTDCEAVLLKLSSTENAHAQILSETEYSTNICLSAEPGTMYCSERENTCYEYEECVLSISGETNAHLGDCNAYYKKICCKIT